MEEEARNDTLVQRAAWDLFEGVAPERAAELSSLWDQYHSRFNVLPNTGGDGTFVFNAGAYRDVRFKHRVMRIFWVSSYST